MPVLREGQEKRTARRGRLWLLALLGVPVIALLLGVGLALRLPLFDPFLPPEVEVVWEEDGKTVLGTVKNLTGRTLEDARVRVSGYSEIPIPKFPPGKTPMVVRGNYLRVATPAELASEQPLSGKGPHWSSDFGPTGPDTGIPPGAVCRFWLPVRPDKIKKWEVLEHPPWTQQGTRLRMRISSNPFRGE